MADEAPRSSRHVRMRLIREGVAEHVIDRMEITTRVATTGNSRFMAETVVSRPRLGPADLQEVDRMVASVFKALPGFGGTYAIAGVEQTYTVRWSGITRPI